MGSSPSAVADPPLRPFRRGRCAHRPGHAGAGAHVPAATEPARHAAVAAVVDGEGDPEAHAAPDRPAQARRHPGYRAVALADPATEQPTRGALKTPNRPRGPR